MTTEVAGNPLGDHTVLSVRRYEAEPPANLSQDVVDPENTYATTKEEEWVTKKKTELTTTRQIETRVKRQVVLEDGKVVGDSGPIVTTNTTEDTESQEHKQTEHRTMGDDPPGPDWVAIPGPDGLVKEVKERKVISREEREERTETEDVQHLGDITDEAFQAAIQSKQDVREVLLASSPQHGELVSTSPKVVHQSCKTHKVVDTEDTQELSQVQEDGRLVTETRRTTEHEEIRDKEEPDDDKASHSEEEETKRESSHRYTKTKDQDLVEYIADGVKIGEEMRYVAENTEGERHGEPADVADHQEWDSLSTRIRRMRRQSKGQHSRAAPHAGAPFGAAPVPMDRKDALTKKPLDFDQEEETRKVETSKWLEHHFGSDSRSSKDSIDDDDIPVGGSTSYINVTMKSRPINSNTTVTSRVVTPINGHQSPSPKGYTATVNTSSRVFVSSPEPEGAASGYFQGVSEWSERRNDIRENRTTFTPRVQVLPAGPNHTFTSKSSPHSSNNHLDRISPHQASRAVYESSNFLTAERNAYKHSNGRRSPYQHKSSDRSTPHQDIIRDSPVEEYNNRSSPYPNMDRSSSPYNQKSPQFNGAPNGDVEMNQSPQPPYRRRQNDREDEEHNYRYEKEGTLRRHKAEPPPDYSPPTNRATPSPSPSPERGTPPPETTPTNKKLYQRTRFAADIPPPPARQQTHSRAKSPGQSATSIIGESFRKLVGKFRSASSERKNKRRNKRSSRSPSPRTSSTYQQYHVIDNNIPSVVGPNKSRVGRRGGDSGEAEAEGGESNDMQQPVAPPRSSRSVRSGMDRNYQRRGASPVVQRFYLGEDPFGGSIYGREREYDGVTPVKSSRRHHKQQNGYRRGSHPGEEEDMNRANVSSSTLGRLSKSTSRLTNGTGDNSLSRGAQTLPRKLYDERIKNQVYIQQNNATTESHRWDPNRLNRINKSQPHSNSMINVSIINNVTPPTSSLGINKPLSNGISLTSTGPAKPARTYRSNLSRSKSFNVHAGSPDANEPSSLLHGSRNRDTSNVYKSNPHLHRLDESPPPLKSPGILASISRSQRDLSASIERDDIKEENSRFSKSTSNLISNGYTTTSHDAKKKLFMKGLMDRAPELYKTLHGDEIPESKPLSPSPVGRLYSSTPVKNGTSSNLSSSRVLDYSSSFRSSSTNATPENDSIRGRPLSSPYRPSMINGSDRITSPVGNKPNFTSTLTHTPSYRDTNGTTTSIVRRGSIGNDDYSETVRITSKSDDPIRPSVTNTVQSYSKKTVPRGHARETIESSETTTVTKSRYRGGDSNQYSLRNGGGGVVIEVRPTRK